MKREITINTRVVCGFAAQPPSPARLIQPRWGKSFVCSTLPSSTTLLCHLVLLLLLLRPDRTRAVPQEFPRPFIRDSFARCRELPYSRCLPTLQLTSRRPSIPLDPPSRRWRLLDKISSLPHRESLASPASASRPARPAARGAFLIGCHYYLFFSFSRYLQFSLNAQCQLSYAAMFPLNSLFVERYLLLHISSPLYLTYKIPPHRLLLLPQFLTLSSFSFFYFPFYSLQFCLAHDDMWIHSYRNSFFARYPFQSSFSRFKI